MRKQDWRSRLRKHPLFAKLVEYGKELNEHIAKINDINQAVEQMRCKVPREIMLWMPQELDIRISPVWKRSIHMSQIGKFYSSWVSKDGLLWNCSWLSINLSLIGKGRVSNKLFPLAYLLGCVSDFELLAMSGSGTYKSMVKDLIARYPAWRPKRHASGK